MLHSRLSGFPTASLVGCTSGWVRRTLAWRIGNLPFKVSRKLPNLIQASPLLLTTSHFVIKGLGISSTRQDGTKSICVGNPTLRTSKKSFGSSRFFGIPPRHARITISSSSRFALVSGLAFPCRRSECRASLSTEKKTLSGSRLRVGRQCTRSVRPTGSGSAAPLCETRVSPQMELRIAWRTCRHWSLLTVY